MYQAKQQQGTLIIGAFSFVIAMVWWYALLEIMRPVMYLEDAWLYWLIVATAITGVGIFAIWQVNRWLADEKREEAQDGFRQAQLYEGQHQTAQANFRAVQIPHLNYLIAMTALISILPIGSFLLYMYLTTWPNLPDLWWPIMLIMAVFWAISGIFFWKDSK